MNYYSVCVREHITVCALLVCMCLCLLTCTSTVCVRVCVRVLVCSADVCVFDVCACRVCCVCVCVAVDARRSAVGVPSNYALGTLRLSVGLLTTPHEVDRCAQLVVDAVGTLCALSSPLLCVLRSHAHTCTPLSPLRAAHSRTN